MLDRHFIAGNGIPTGFREVSFLESSGKEYIPTGFVPTTACGFRVMCRPKSSVTSTSGKYGCVFGGRVSSGSKDFQLTTYVQSSGWKGTVRWGNSGTLSGDAGLDVSAVHEYTLLDKVYSGATKSKTFTAADVAGTKEIFLFGLNNNGSVTQAGSGAVIHWVRFYDAQGRMVRDFVPVVRRADGKPGMWDRCGSLSAATGTPFYVNSGSGEFVYG